MAGKPLNLQQVADLFGVSEASVKAWRREGLPVKSGGGHGKPMKFDRDAVTAWAARNKKASLSSVTGVKEEKAPAEKPDYLDLEQEKAELTREQKRLARDKRRIIRGKYLRRNEVQDQITDCIAHFATRLHRFDEQLDAPPEIREQAREKMEALLSKMADELNKIPAAQAKRQKDRFINTIDKEGKTLAKSSGK